MRRCTLLSLLSLLVPAAASAQAVTINHPPYFNGMTANVTGTGSAAGFAGSTLTINGLPKPQGYFSVNPNVLPSRVGLATQTAVHSVRAEVRDGLGNLLDADQVAFYDLPEFLAVPTPFNTPVPQASVVRITDQGLGKVAGRAAVEVMASHSVLEAEVANYIDPNGPELDVELPVSVCFGLGSLGLDLDVLNIGPVDLGIEVDLFDAMVPGDFELCVEGVGFDAEVHADDLYHPGDWDLDGLPDDLVALDAKPNRLEARVATGPLSLEGTLTLHSVLQLSASPITLLPVGVTIDAFPFDLVSNATIGIDGADASCDIALGVTSLGRVDATQPPDALEFHLHNLALDAPALVLGLVPTAEAILDAAEPVLEDLASCIFSKPHPDEPLLETMLDQALAKVPINTTVPIGLDKSSIDVIGLATAIREDEDGIEIDLDLTSGRSGLGSSANLVRGEPNDYRPTDVWNGFGPATDYDMAVAIADASLTQSTSAVWRTGYLHTHWTLASDLPTTLDPSVPAGAPITPDILDALLTGIASLVPAGTDLEVTFGPDLAPVVLVEDTPWGARVATTAFQQQLQVWEMIPGSPRLWVEVVADLKLYVALKVGDDGQLTASVGDHAFTMLVTHVDDVAMNPVTITVTNELMDRVRTRMRSGALAATVATELPTLGVPGYLADPTTLTFAPLRTELDSGYVKLLNTFEFAP
ncbi:MAG: hypothetical protein H6738_03950 [Alphaproteobacteria bacterium]|nr:hypothetical protein [Alphaproteobacteria bacterium]MCB9695923.1 hypothetical protein [Alphaproteobacteria bacterium]